MLIIGIITMPVLINCEPLPEDVVCLFLCKIIQLAIVCIDVHLNLQQGFVCNLNKLIGSGRRNKRCEF